MKDRPPEHYDTIQPQSVRWRVRKGAALSELILSISIEPLDEGGYLATSDDLQGLIAQGCTMGETLEIAQDVACKLIKSYLEHGDPLPPKFATAPSFTKPACR